MGEQADQQLESLQRQTEEWLQEFPRSQHFGSLTARQKRVFKRIVGLFVKTMYAHHGRLPQKWTVHSVETCCLETLPESGAMKEQHRLAMPPVLAAFFGFLEERGQIRNGAALIRAVHRVLERSLKSVGEDGTTGHAGLLPEPFMVGVGAEETMRTLRQFAAQIAREISRDRPAMISREVMQIFEKQPVLIFDLLQLLSEQFAPEGRMDDYQISAYFILLSHSLQNIRFGMDRHFDWAREIYREFQSAVVRQAREENFSPQLLVGILESVSEAKLEISQEMLDVYEFQITNFAPQMDLPTRGQIDAMFESLVEEHGGEPFAISETLAQMTRALPFDAQSALIGEFAFSNLPGMKDAVVILCLHAEEVVRHEALQWLQKNVRHLTPTALRRLIVIRNWLPEKERKLLDALIKAARIKGVECAQWAAGAPMQSLQASQMDGVGAQSLMVSIAMENRLARIGAVLLKQNVGVADAWITPSISRQEVSMTFRQAGKREFFLEVSETYLHAAIRHNIAVGLAKGAPPSVGLLQCAESIAATEWMPGLIDFHHLVEEMIQNEGTRLLDAQTLEGIVQSSGVWGDIPKITNSWFEESQEVATFLENTRIRNPERLLRQVLELFCEPNREIWAERFAWTAFWLHEQTAKVRKLAGNDLHFAVMARELYRGRPLHELPLMRSIAMRTVNGESGWS
ncbi:MAG: hypothetical protein HQM02_09850 [Magnetococcales bacterium]|nr:hypothetical protein [Magnetococcales bacterium]